MSCIFIHGGYKQLENLILITAFILIVFSAPAYVSFISNKVGSMSTFWQLYFADAQPRVMLTFITFPIIGALSVIELVLCIFGKSVFTKSMFISACFTLCWSALLISSLFVISS